MSVQDWLTAQEKRERDLLALPVSADTKEIAEKYAAALALAAAGVALREHILDCDGCLGFCDSVAHFDACERALEKLVEEFP